MRSSFFWDFTQRRLVVSTDVSVNISVSPSRIKVVTLEDGTDGLTGSSIINYLSTLCIIPDIIQINQPS
jgi:hypothetical protein